MKDIVSILKDGNYSCVIKNDEKVRVCSKKGVADLYDIYTQDPHFLKGAFIADKIVGKAAAAIMIAAGVKKIHALTISTSALNLLNEQSHIEFTYDNEIPVVINRDKTDWCPLEKLCFKEKSIHTIINYVKTFYDSSNR
jgi:hypothetical protein